MINEEKEIMIFSTPIGTNEFYKVFKKFKKFNKGKNMINEEQETEKEIMATFDRERTELEEWLEKEWLEKET